MALSTRSEGGNGFSFEASLMTSVRPNSRSSSSIGFPGSYGAIPRMWSLAMDSHDTVMSGSLGGRVGSEDLEELAALFHFVEDSADVVRVPVSLEVDEVHVFPRTPLGRSRLDLGEVEPARREGLEDAIEHAGLVLHREEDGRLVPAARPDGLPPDDEKAGRVGRVVLDAAPQDRDVVHPRGELRGHGRHGDVVAGALGRGGRGRHLLHARVRY